MFGTPLPNSTECTCYDGWDDDNIFYHQESCSLPHALVLGYPVVLTVMALSALYVLFMTRTRVKSKAMLRLSYFAGAIFVLDAVQYWGVYIQ